MPADVGQARGAHHPREPLAADGNATCGQFGINPQPPYVPHLRAWITRTRTVNPVRHLHEPTAHVEDARHAARALITDAAAGDRAALTIPTVWAFAPTFLADFAERWKPATRKPYTFTVRRWILPAFGKWRVDAVGANCCHEILRTMFACAIA